MTDHTCLCSHDYAGHIGDCPVHGTDRREDGAMKDRDYSAEIAAHRAARNIFEMLDGNRSPEAVLAALRLAYSTGARDQARQHIQGLVEFDDRLNEVT